MKSRFTANILILIAALSLFLGTAARTHGESLAVLPPVIVGLILAAAAFLAIQGMIFGRAIRALRREAPDRQLTTFLTSDQTWKMIAPQEKVSSLLPSSGVVELTPEGLAFWRGSGSLRQVGFLPYDEIQQASLTSVKGVPRNSFKVEIVLTRSQRPTSFVITPLRELRFLPLEATQASVGSLASKIDAQVVQHRRLRRPSAS